MKRAIIAIAVAVAIVIAAGATLYLNNQTPEPPQVALPAPVIPAPISPPVAPPPIAPVPILPPSSPPALPPTPPVVPPPIITLPPPTTPAPTIPIPPNFLFPDAIWQNAFMLRDADGSKWRPVVGFSQIPVGTIIHAPISGYLNAATAIWGEQRGATQLISIYGKGLRYPPYFQVTGAGLEILTPPGKSRVEKGEPWIKITDNREIAIGRFDRQVFLMVTVVPRDRNVGVINETTDPREFIKKMIEKLN